MMKTLGIALIATFAWIQTSLANDDAWLTDLTKAKALARKENKIVLMDFTGSDWCPPCKALHRNVLTAKEFTDFAKENLVLVLVDFPTGKPLPADQQKANNALKDTYSVRAFPTLIALDSSGKKIWSEEGYAGTSAKDFVAKLKKLPGTK